MKMIIRNLKGFRGRFWAAGLFLALFCGCVEMPARNTADAAVSGVYEGEGTGFRGKVRVSVALVEGGIAEIT
ncbi:MAG: hypothetical protein LBD71_02925, partial [Treponema sp.]|nr:hypothetical protein [Treponema sp.]